MDFDIFEFLLFRLITQCLLAYTALYTLITAYYTCVMNYGQLANSIVYTLVMPYYTFYLESVIREHKGQK